MPNYKLKANTAQQNAEFYSMLVLSNWTIPLVKVELANLRLWVGQRSDSSTCQNEID